MVFKDGEIQGIGHVATFAEGIDRTEREYGMQTGERLRPSGTATAAALAPPPGESVHSAV